MIDAPQGDLRAPDGSPVVVFSTFPSGNAPAYINERLAPKSTVLDLGCGAGRIAHPLATAGHHVTGVDLSPEMIDRFVGQDVAPGATSWPTKAEQASGGRRVRALATGTLEGIVADIDGLDLRRRFDAVVLASYLINDPDRERAHRYLETCRRHVVALGCVYIQRHHPAFLDNTDVVESAEDGYGFRYERLSRSGDTVTGRMTYLHDDDKWEQEFVTTILDDPAFVGALECAGLKLARWLDEFETWAEAVPA